LRLKARCCGGLGGTEDPECGGATATDSAGTQPGCRERKPQRRGSAKPGTAAWPGGDVRLVSLCPRSRTSPQELWPCILWKAWLTPSPATFFPHSGLTDRAPPH